MEDNKSTRLEITYREASLLVPYDKNAKIHEEDQIDQIAASIKEFGFTNPILLDGDNGVIAGHGRLRAAQKMGMEQVPTVELSHLSEAQKRAYILADNRLAEVNTSWDFDLVSIELNALQADGFEIELTGFDDGFLIEDVPETDFPSLNSDDREPFQQMAFTVHDEQKTIVDDALMKARTRPEIDTGMNENSNGNALAAICEAYVNGVS
jgi:ParB family chromosome partitioning protein